MQTVVQTQSVVLLQILTPKEVLQVSEVLQILEEGWKAHHTYLIHSSQVTAAHHVTNICKNWYVFLLKVLFLHQIKFFWFIYCISIQTPQQWKQF